jgi:hypothetical protein
MIDVSGELSEGSLERLDQQTEPRLQSIHPSLDHHQVELGQRQAEAIRLDIGP